ncbi:hypothetical protein K493DRAFT_356893 [Basidiobolus meristosporus CBS 931.73]|uniref:Uncharacterized protein n=1 Tax=Basidiobolus meristosporus CBS 931.73 TaxID=1314790 RepID=A0A1Y1XXD2_9FUNG|nr:hypothetical protein K493DRAFT_356893 [Basidiobolus meristosporus CBS 931.73]|eukprot:ORX90400.1 hypothetical protein K493DRAFT_356893 [Basidiobolus meristosporus CBS 931.73]
MVIPKAISTKQDKLLKDIKRVRDKIIDNFPSNERQQALDELGNFDSLTEDANSFIQAGYTDKNGKSDSGEFNHRNLGVHRS